MPVLHMSRCCVLREGVKPNGRCIRMLRRHEHTLLGAELRDELLQHREALGDDLGVLRQPGRQVEPRARPSSR